MIVNICRYRYVFTGICEYAELFARLLYLLSMRGKRTLYGFYTLGGIFIADGDGIKIKYDIPHRNGTKRVSVYCPELQTSIANGNPSPSLLVGSTQTPKTRCIHLTEKTRKSVYDAQKSRMN